MVWGGRVCELFARRWWLDTSSSFVTAMTGGSSGERGSVWDFANSGGGVR